MPVALTEHGRRCRRAHSGYLTLSRQPTTTLRPPLARSAARLPWEPLSHIGPLDLARVLANVHDRHPNVSLNCASPRTVRWAPAIGRRWVNALSLAPSNMSLINRRMESLPNHLLNVKQFGLVVPGAGGGDAGRALSHDGSMRYAQRGGHTSVEQQRWERLRQQSAERWVPLPARGHPLNPNLLGGGTSIGALTWAFVRSSRPSSRPDYMGA
jgi:hypothetical protein